MSSNLVLLCIIALPLLLVIFVISFWYGYQLAKEVEIPNNVPACFRDENLVRFAFPAILALGVLYLPGYFLGLFGSMPDVALKLYKHVGTWLLIGVFVMVISTANGLPPQRLSERYVFLSTLFLASTAVLYLVAFFQWREELHTKWVRGSYDYYGPARIVDIQEMNYDDAAAMMDEGDYDHWIGVQWYCKKQDVSCKVTLPLDCADSYFDTHGYNKWSIAFHEEYLKVHVYNVGNDDTCDQIASLVNTNNNDNDNDVDTYKISPVKDGSPYIKIFGNCSSTADNDGQCTARKSSKNLDRKAHLPANALKNMGIYTFLAMIAAFVTYRMSTSRHISPETGNPNVELMPPGTIS